LFERSFDFCDHLVGGNVGEAGGEIRKQAFKRQKFVQ
jgi:hypothetical protein